MQEDDCSSSTFSDVGSNRRAHRRFHRDHRALGVEQHTLDDAAGEELADGERRFCPITSRSTSSS